MKMDMQIRPTSTTSSARVCIVQNEHGNPLELLAEVVQQAGLEEVIERKRSQLHLAKADFRILIKPDMELFDYRASTGADPLLVEELIDLLHEKGYTNVVVADAEGSASLWLDNREVLVLADLAGYRFVTSKGNDYEVLNLSEALADAGFPEGSSLAGTELSEYWLSAHFRINFCKNKTDEAHGFALGLHNLMGVLPLKAKSFHYKLRLKQEEVALDLHRHTPFDFTIIDAWCSNHGSQGSRCSNPLHTCAFIASESTLLADWAGALKMGLDPYLSPLNAKVLRTCGLPNSYWMEGDLTPWPGWKSPSIHIRESTAKRNASPLTQRLAEACLQTVNTDLFPFKNMVDSRLNAVLAHRLKEVDDNSAARWGLTAINYALANLEQFRQAWQVLFDKDSLHRMDTRLNVDVDKLDNDDFESIEDYILPFQAILRYTLPDRNGLRRRYIDGSIIFEYIRIIPVDFEDFINRVDICQAVQMMYDNIGGARVVLKNDEQNRALYQVERDLYLPQPNWMVLFGGRHIDVDKIEVIRYAEHSRRNFWRTVHSANQSAEYDDGMVAFEKDPGGTRVTIVARQKFALPLFWQLFDMDYLPDVKEALVSDAYSRFFSRTMANFEAAAEGRAPFIGKPWDARYGEETHDGIPPEIEHLKYLFSMLAGIAEKWLRKDDAPAGTTALGTDEHGFRHFAPQSTTDTATEGVSRFFSELASAIGKDIQLLGK
jgi:uncharacterized protein (DUF362 family)